MLVNVCQGSTGIHDMFYCSVVVAYVHEIDNGLVFVIFLKKIDRFYYINKMLDTDGLGLASISF